MPIDSYSKLRCQVKWKTEEARELEKHLQKMQKLLPLLQKASELESKIDLTLKTFFNGK